MNQNMRRAAILALVLTVPAGAAQAAGKPAQSAKARAAAALLKDCGCVNPGPHQMMVAVPRREATPDVVSLFAAASEGDEATFGRLVGAVGDINDFVVDGNKLLHALLQPARSMDDYPVPSIADDEIPTRAQWEAMLDARMTRWQVLRARHLALLPAKTRMLALALQQGAAVNDGNQNADAAALHLAAMFGTREMVEMLLAHGADLRQRGGADHEQAPLAFALAPNAIGAVATELITSDERSAIVLALLAAGAQRPLLDQDADKPLAFMRPAQKGRAPVRVKHADLLWDHWLQLTTGTAVLDQLERTGTAPYATSAERSLYGSAAAAGNAAAIGWLKKRIPRFDQDHNDRWLDAAMLALYLPGPSADAVLTQLLVKGMDWSQPGPLTSPYQVSPDYSAMQSVSSSGPPATVLVHAARAGRADWVARLLALGALQAPGTDALAAAVEDGSPATVALLLDAGVDPLAGEPSALQRALYLPAVPGEEASASDLPPQATELLPLLLKHIVAVQGTPVADIVPAPLSEAAEHVAEPGGPARVRLLLGAGFDATSVSEAGALAVLASPDRALAAALLDGGMLRGQARGAAILPRAVREGRADLLVRLMQLGYDPNLRSGMDPNAVDEAIARGDPGALALLLAGGGRIDLAARDGRGSGVLDFAVASGNAAILRQVTGDFALGLDRVCLPDTEALVNTVLYASDSWWDLLRQHGFATDGQACPGMSARVVTALADTPARVLAGWIGANLRARLAQLGGAGTAPGANPPAPVAQDPALQAADAALRKSLPGTYALQGETEIDSALLLRDDGTFVYAFNYGAGNETAQGNWAVRAGQMLLDTAASATVPFYQLTTSTAPAMPDGDVMVRIGTDARMMRGLAMTLLGDAPLFATGRLDGAGWTARFAAKVRQIVVTGTSHAAARPIIIDVPVALAMERVFVLTPDPAWREPMDFHVSLESRDGVLVWPRLARDLYYKKVPAGAD